MEGKDKVSTEKATAGAMNKLKDFLTVKNHPKIEDLTSELLGPILYDFYAVIKPQKSEDYSVQTLKCIQSRLARYFRSMKGIDIIKDTEFVQANEMF